MLHARVRDDVFRRVKKVEKFLDDLLKAEKPFATGAFLTSFFL